MAFDAFLKIAGIPGESTDDKHKEWTELISFQMGVDQPATASASSVGSLSAERANWRQFVINKQIDKGSPKLALACASGEHVADVTIEVCRAGGDKQPYMEYKLTDVMISSFSTSAAKNGDLNGDSVPYETVQFNYGKIELKYTQLSVAGGKPAGNVAAGWDLKTNKKV